MPLAITVDRFAARRFAIHHQHQQEGETKHDGQQQGVKGRVLHSFGEVHMRYVSTSTS
jgi:hypothetical protein